MTDTRTTHHFIVEDNKTVVENGLGITAARAYLVEQQKTLRQLTIYEGDKKRGDSWGPGDHQIYPRVEPHLTSHVRTPPRGH